MKQMIDWLIAHPAVGGLLFAVSVMCGITIGSMIRHRPMHPTDLLGSCLVGVAVWLAFAIKRKYL